MPPMMAHDPRRRAGPPPFRAAAVGSARGVTPPSAIDQIAELSLEAARPLIVSDADEVLFLFMASFEPYLEANGHYFDWSSYALDGNIRRRGDGSPAPEDDIARLLGGFFDARTADMDVAPGAPEALAALSRRAQVVVLSNLPWARRRERRRALADNGMDYPLVSNAGPKGPAVAALARRAGTPVFFIDDGWNHHESVAASAGAVRRLHMIAHPRLAEICPPAPGAHYRVDDWPAARAIIEAELAAAGF